MDTVTIQQQRITYTNVSVSMLKQHIKVLMSPTVEYMITSSKPHLYCHKFYFKSLESFGLSYILIQACQRSIMPKTDTSFK